jgi:ribonuclease P protein component
VEPAVPEVRVIPLSVAQAGGLRVRITGTRAADGAVDAAWDAMRRANPALFDGPALLVDAPASGVGELVAQRATYRHVAALRASDAARLLGVKAIVIAPSASGAPRALVGLRSSSSRVYAGMWEFVPAGTVAPPAPPAAGLGVDALIEALQAEAREELGLDLPASACTPVALVDDPDARSLDVLLLCRLVTPVERMPRACAAASADTREHAAIEWADVPSLPAWAGASPSAVAPPTRAIIAALPALLDGATVGPVALTFRPRHRLTHARQFQAVYAGACRKNRGPLTVYTLPNALPHPRLGLAIGARAGNAVVRSRTKRLVREAFRLGQHDLARDDRGGGYDIIVSVRGTPPTALAGLIKTLRELVADADREWRRRGRRDAAHPPRSDA